MSAINKIRNPHARAALLAGLGLLLGGSLAGVARAQGPAKAQSPVAAQAQVPYKSSIQVPFDSTAKHEGREAHRGGKGRTADEQAEAAGYQKLARITADQARSAALAKVPGTAKTVRLMNDEGNLVYGVRVMTSAGPRWVKIDAGNGNVLQVREGRKR
jgi:uncharacterized membrane protein YkoI